MEPPHDHVREYQESVLVWRVGESRSPRFAASRPHSPRALDKPYGAHRFCRKTMARTVAGQETNIARLASIHSRTVQTGNRTNLWTLEKLSGSAAGGRTPRHTPLAEH